MLDANLWVKNKYNMQQSRKISVKRFRVALGSILFSGLFALPAEIASAETLREALAFAYLNNPTLEAQRAGLRATDEEVPKALSGLRPKLRAEAETSKSFGDVSTLNPSLDELNSWGYSVTLDQPLFRGFRTLNSIKQAKATVKAGREDLRTQEQAVLQSAVTAYVNVIRDLATLKLQKSNVKVLDQELQAVKDRFQLGSATRTGVSQATARKAGAKSQLALAQSNLKTSLAVYEQIIGHKAIGLKQPNIPVNLLPRTLDEAIKIGLAQNPSILAAIYREEASSYSIDIIRGELLPDISLQATYEKTYTDGPSGDDEDFSIVARLTMPLYAGGNISARERQAHQNNIFNMDQVSVAKDQVKQSVISSWANLLAAKAQLQSYLQAVKANKVALAGVRQEKDVGQRTLLSVLNAEQELLISQVSLVQTKRNIAVASYALLQSIGKLNIDKVGAPVTTYDPKANYDSNLYKLFGLSIDMPEK